jgi:hypothetical protein
MRHVAQRLLAGLQGAQQRSWCASIAQETKLNVVNQELSCAMLSLAC